MSVDDDVATRIRLQAEAVSRLNAVWEEKWEGCRYREWFESELSTDAKRSEWFIKQLLIRIDDLERAFGES